MKTQITYVPDEGWLAEIDHNQCDGCMANQPLVGVIHRGPTRWAMQVCTSERYPLPESKLENSEKNAREWIEDRIWEVQYPGRI